MGMIKVLGHPIHQQLVVLPLGVLTTAVAFDLITDITGNLRWTQMAFFLIGAGILTALAAAVFGLLDWLTIPEGTRAKRVGALHGLGNVIVVILFAGSFFLRWSNPLAAPPFAYLCSYVAILLALVTGWLGGELVDRLGVGVDIGAGLNAPSSLQSDLRQRRPAA